MSFWRIGRLHWSGRLRSRTFHFGVFRTGNCWRVGFDRHRFSNVTFYTFWRMFFALDAPR
jgi:hypothetical protein